MSTKMILFSTLFLLLLAVPASALNEQDISIYQALKIAEKVEMGNFTSVVKIVDFWAVKGSNLHNTKPCELLINARTSLIVSAKNITPKTIILGENTYEYSGTNYPYSEKFYKTNQIYNGFEIYRNDSHYFRIKQAIFIRNEEGFVAYFMTKGPGKTK
ncbi:MAG: hypothetical protein KAX49_13190 [Halanaerobiales bacterium]|nr:hypothetical protein [Halanaerobiales bacterium]